MQFSTQDGQTTLYQQSHGHAQGRPSGSVAVAELPIEGAAAATSVNSSARSPRARRVRQAIRGALAGVALAALTVVPAFAESGSYTVQPGDTLNALASRLGLPAGELVEINSISNPDLLRVGQVLRLAESEPAERFTPISRAETLRFQMPVPGRITSVFGEPGHLWRTGYHPGLDIGAPLGTPIRSTAPGVVIEAESSGYNSGYGHYVKVDHGGGLHSLYAHMSTVSAWVGQSVTGDTVLGVVGLTGLTTGPHVHWEMRQNGVKRDPLLYVR